MKQQNNDRGSELLFDIADGEGPDALTADEAEALKEALKPHLALLRRFDDGKKKVMSALWGIDEGKTFEYGGASWVIKKHSKSVAYRDAYMLALAEIED